MPLNPLTLIAGAESNYGTKTINPESSARGVWQDLTRTWQEYSCAVGYCGTYATANDAPYSVQAAANAYGFNKYGFQPWSSNQVLMSEVANAGGASAFSAPGTLSTSVSDYSSLDSAGGLQAYFNNNSGGSFIGSVSIASQASGGDASPNASPTSKPFSNSYALLIDGSAQGINTNIQAVQNLVNPWLTPALAISIIVVAIATMFGRVSINSLFSHFIRASIVVAFVAPGGSFYTTYVVNPIVGMPTYIASAFGVPNAGPAAVFDDAYITLWTLTETILNNTHVSVFGDGLGTVIVAIILYGIGAICLAILFGPYLAVNYLLLLTTVFGRLVIVAALFRVLDKWLMGWVDVVATLVVLMLAIDVVISLYQGIIVQMFNGFIPSAVGDKDIPAFGGLVGILGLMAFTVGKYLVPFVVRMFGGIGIPLEAGAVFLAQQGARAARFAR
jgi:hypothetical protein